MCGCLIVCRSLTYAQRSAKCLRKGGILSDVLRLPGHLSQEGCQYAVKVPEPVLGEALVWLKNNGLTPKRVYMAFEDGTFSEVPS